MEPREFASMRNEVARRPGLKGPGRRAALTTLTDDWLQELFAQAQELVSSPLCLLAVGGYGRGELTVGSDIDLVLLHSTRASDVGPAADALWYPIWDSGVRLDHSVRTVSEARLIASSDVKVVLGMLDARVIAGDEALAAQLTSGVLADWRAMAADRLLELHGMVRDRRSQFGELSQMVEPQIKESYGGLRDAAILTGITASWLTDVPHTGWQDSVQFLLDVRDSLHLRTGRAQDSLVMQEQEAVAEDVLGAADPDELLRRVYEGARTIAYASDVAWHRVERIAAGRQRKSFRAIKRRTPARVPLADGVVLQNGEAVLALDAQPAKDPGLALRAAAAAAQAGVLLSPHTVDRLALECPDLPATWTRAMRESFISLIGSGPALPQVWEALDQAGLIHRWIPEWAAVRSAPQRNALHRFTVDRHLLETAVRASALTRNVDRPDLLLMGALLHDIGKARGGDHSRVGAEIALDLCARMGFDDDDTRVVEMLVRHHLVLADTATRRDLDDPDVVGHMAAIVGSIEVLDLLHEVTVADSLATGPTVCTEWRFGLMADLTRRTRRVLDGRPLPEPPSLSEHQRLALSQEGVWVLMEEGESAHVITVSARDQLGLLGTVAGVLALNRLHVLAARVTTVDGRAVQEWTVRPVFGDPPSAPQLSEDVRRAIEGTYDVADRLRAREADQPASSMSAPAPTVRVIRHPDGSSAVVEIRAHDAAGLLYRVARAVAAADVDITGAKVSTLGSEVVDAFFVRAPDGGLLSDERLDALRVTVLSTLASPLSPAPA